MKKAELKKMTSAETALDRSIRKRPDAPKMSTVNKYFGNHDCNVNYQADPAVREVYVGWEDSSNRGSIAEAEEFVEILKEAIAFAKKFQAGVYVENAAWTKKKEEAGF